MAKRIRKLAVEVVVVHEDCIQCLRKQLLRQFPIELVEPYVQIREIWDVQHNLRKRPAQLVVAEIELEERLQVLERLGNSAEEPVRVQMKQPNFAKQTQLRHQASFQILPIQIYPCHHFKVRKFRIFRRGAEHTLVAAHIRPYPRLGDPIRVIGDGLLPRLQSSVSSPLAPRRRMLPHVERMVAHARRLVAIPWKRRPIILSFIPCCTTCTQHGQRTHQH